MSLQKFNAFRSRKLLDRVRELPCQNVSCCGGGQSEPAHYQGPMSYSLGKGTSKKPTDAVVAALCHECHALYDNREHIKGRDVDQQDFWIAHGRTFNLLFNDGYLKID